MRKDFPHACADLFRSGGVRYLCRTLAILVGISFFLIIIGTGLRRNVSPLAETSLYDPELAARYAALREPVIDRTRAPDFWQDVDYSEGEQADWWPKGESPILAELVESGDLPPIEERVGPEPAVYSGFAGIGTYGGDWWRMAEDIDGVRLVMQYELKNNTLVRFSPYGEPIRPHLAREVVPSDTYKIWTVHLRRGVKWSDGVPFTADDILWWWEKVKQNPDIGFIDETMKVNGKTGDIEKIDAYTLRYIFPEPNPGWLRQQASAAGALYMAAPMHYMQQFHPTEGNQELIDTLSKQRLSTPNRLFREMNHPLNPERPKLGPWLFRTHRNNGPWTAVRNPYYFVVDKQGNQLPYIDRIIFRQINKQLQPKALTDGVSSFALNTGADYASVISQQENGDYQVRHWTPEQIGRLTISPNRNLPATDADKADEQKRDLLRNKEFRRALSIAIDRQAIIDSEFKGVGRPAALMPTEGVPWFDEEALTDNAQFDPERANRLLDVLELTRRDSEGMRTLPDGSRLTLFMIARPGETAPLQFLLDDWRAVGLRVIIKEKPHRLFMQSSRNADLVVGNGASTGVLGWGALGAGAYWEWYYKGGLYGSEASKALALQPTPIEIEAMQAGEDAANGFDPAERLRLARKVMDIARDQVWTINIGTASARVTLVKNGLKGVPDNLLFSFTLNSPNNAAPETWYWENPTTINGSEPSSDEYLQDRRAAIRNEILMATPKEGGSTLTATENAAESLLGNIFKWCCLGILFAGWLLLILRHPFVLRRMIIMIPTLVIISIIVFTGVQLPPGNYLQTVINNLEQSGNLEQAEEEIKNVTETYHLDDGPVKNYFRWTGLLWFTSFSDEDTGLLQGNLGRSMSNDGAFVSDLLGDRLLLTMCISLGTIMVTWLVAIPIGVYSAVRQYSIADYVLTIGGFIGMCIPQFILALVLMLLAKEVFGLTMMGLFSGQYAIQEHWDWAKVIDLLKHIWVPIIIVGASGTAGMIRVMRANLLDELKKPYVTTARAKGMRPLKLLFKYPFRMALNPFVSGIGRLFPMLISGSAIVAIILSLPTVGPLLLNAVMYEDTYMAGSLLLIISAFSVFGVLVSDLLLMLLDPRIRMDGESEK